MQLALAFNHMLRSSKTSKLPMLRSDNTIHNRCLEREAQHNHLAQHSPMHTKWLLPAVMDSAQ